MRRQAVLPVLALLLPAVSVVACGPTGTPAPGASGSPKPSGAPSTAGSATPGAPGSPAPVEMATPTPRPTAAPVTLKVLVDGKPASIEPLAYLTSVTVTGNTSFFWNVGTFAKSGDANIGQGYGLLKEGEGNITLHMKYGEMTGAAALRTMTDAEFKGGVNMTYKEGPKCLTWYANAANYTSGAFTVEGDVVTFKLVATIAGDKRGNDGTTRKFEIEIAGLPKPAK